MKVYILSGSRPGIGSVSVGDTNTGVFMLSGTGAEKAAGGLTVSLTTASLTLTPNTIIFPRVILTNQTITLTPVTFYWNLKYNLDRASLNLIPFRFPLHVSLTLTPVAFYWVVSPVVIRDYLIGGIWAGAGSVVVADSYSNKTQTLSQIAVVDYDISTPAFTSLTSASLTLAAQTIKAVKTANLSTASLSLSPQSFRAIDTVNLTTDALTLSPQGFNVNVASNIAQASLTLSPQTISAGAAVSVDQASLTLSPQTITWFVSFAIATADLTLTPNTTSWSVTGASTTHSFPLPGMWAGAGSVVVADSVSQKTYIIADVGIETDEYPVARFVETTPLTLTPVPFDYSWATVFFHPPATLVLTPQDFLWALLSTLHVTHEYAEAAVSTPSDYEQTHEVIEAAVGQYSADSYLRHTQHVAEIATSIANVPFRVSQFAIEVLRGLETEQAMNQMGSIVYPIFPLLPGLGFTVKRSPTFSSSIQQNVSGDETRMGKWRFPTYTYDLVFHMLRDTPTHAEYKTLETFWLRSYAQQKTFLYEDPDDRQRTGQGIAIGNGKETQYQLIRSYTDGVSDWDDPIYAPNVVQNVYIDGILQDPSTWDYTVWGSNIPGVLNTHAAVPNGAVLSVDLSYYWPCRFTNDTQDFEKFLYQMWEVKSLKFVTTKCVNILLLPYHYFDTNAFELPATGYVP